MTAKHAGKVAVITGGTSGIGLATAERLAREGARVFITGRRKAALDAAVDRIGAQATGIQGNVADLGDLDRVFATVRANVDRIDILFANAGGGSFAPLDAITEEHYDDTFDANVKGVLFTVQKALPLLREGSSIILTGSIVASKGYGALSVYSATKAAVRSFARTWATDLKDRKIRVNVVSPGPIDTPGLGLLGGGGDAGEALKKNLATTVPLGRLGLPEEVAQAVSFLGSSESSFVNGTELFVDGAAAQV